MAINEPDWQVASELSHDAPSRAMREQIIRSFCHDLKQPLQAALLRAVAVRHVLERHGEETLIDDLQLSLNEVAAMSESVFDAIQLFREGVPVTRSAVLISRVLGRIRHQLEPLAVRKGLELRIRRNTQLILTDESLLARALTNLVSNALHYTHAGGVLVAARRRTDRLVIEVWDTGPGMHGDALSNMSSPNALHQPDGDWRHRKGLGLWNAQEFARLLGGKLEVESRPGKGTVVRLEIAGEVHSAKDFHGRRHDDVGTDVALVSADRARLMDWQQTILKAGLSCMSFDDPLRFLSHLLTAGRRPALVICDLNLGNLSAEFLGKTLRMRYSDIEVAVLLEDGATAKAKDFKGLGMRVLSSTFGEAEIETLWEAIDN